MPTQQNKKDKKMDRTLNLTVLNTTEFLKNITRKTHTLQPWKIWKPIYPLKIYTLTRIKRKGIETKCLTDFVRSQQFKKMLYNSEDMLLVKR